MEVYSWTSLLAEGTKRMKHWLIVLIQKAILVKGDLGQSTLDVAWKDSVRCNEMETAELDTKCWP